MLPNNDYKSIYRNLFDDFNKEFLIPSYRESATAFRASGFFSLDSLILSSEGIFELVKKNGKLKIICSPILSHSDIEQIKCGKRISEQEVLESLLKEIERSNEISEEIDKMKLDLFCNLIATNIIELKIAFMPDGLYHEKFGIFIDDDGNEIYFNGSFNSTKNGSLSNTESFMVISSWGGYKKVIDDEIKYFNSLWNNDSERVRTLSFPEAAKNALFEKFRSSTSVDESVFNLIRKLSGKKIKNLWPFQEKAIDEFVENGFSHFYEMATGTGKTFTAVRTMKRVSELNGKFFAIILVPQIDIQNQWVNALIDDGYERVYKLGGCNSSKSEQEFTDALINYSFSDESIICVSIYDTFFEKYYLKVDDINSLFIIVDEAHNLTDNYFNKLPKHPKYKLGLSATIQRWHENEANSVVEYFANGKPTFRYSIEDAIEAKFLSRYEYHPIFAYISKEEFEKYKAKTKLLAQKINEKNPNDEEIQKLRTERSLIVKKSSCKIELLKKMITEGYYFKNSVVYCGQGKDNEDSIIDSVTKVLSENDKYIVSQYTSKTENRIQTLYEFENGYFDTLVAIKCFDEGVDVPKLDKIYIMASDASRRQTIQRRGRVLRQCKETNKEIAYIYDMIVLPPSSTIDGSGVKSLLRSEFIRVSEYASLCVNKTVLNEIANKLDEYDCKLEDLINDEERCD